MAKSLAEGWKRYREMVVDQPKMATRKERAAAMMGFYAGAGVVLNAVLALAESDDKVVGQTLAGLMEESSAFTLEMLLGEIGKAEEKRGGRDAKGKGDDAEGFRGGGSAGGGLPN